LTDPDMIYMNRLEVSGVLRGSPAAQFYGYMQGSPFEKYLCDLCPDPQAAYFGQGKNRKHNYDVGPPWLLHIDDFRTIMPTWVGLVPMVYDLTKGAWIVEMLAYTVAMAYHKLPHEVIYYGMIDNRNQKKAWTPTNTIAAPDGVPMALLHYCFTWEVGEVPPRTPVDGGKQHERMVTRDRSRPVMDYLHWSKYRTPSDWPGGNGRYPHNILDCQCPIMQEFHTTNVLPSSSMTQSWHRDMQFIRSWLPLFNDALKKWKLETLNCPIPTVEEEAEFEEAMRQHLAGKGPDPTEHNSKFKFINLSPQLRTSHPTYWISRWVVESVRPDLSNFSYVPAADARRRMWAALRSGTRDRIRTRFE